MARKTLYCMRCHMDADACECGQATAWTKCQIARSFDRMNQLKGG